MFYSGIYIPSVGYCLPVTYFTKAELEDIQRPAHQAMLSRLGFNRTTAQEVALPLVIEDALSCIICMMVKDLDRHLFYSSPGDQDRPFKDK